MALHVDEIMNHEPFSLSPLETVANALRYFSVLKIAAIGLHKLSSTRKAD